jgi:inner membrane protein
VDNLTHSLTGALLGQAGLKRKTGLAMPALIIGANLPDVDAACFFWLDGVEHLGFRRGITHGPIAWVLLPLVLAGLLWWFDRWQTRRGAGRFGRPEGRLPVHFGWLYALSFIACLSHPALDWLNSYGIRLLEPFSSQWFYGDTLFIIDIWLWLGMGFATWFSLRREKRGGDWMKPARIAIVGALAYVGLNVAISFSAADSYPRNQHFNRQAISSPVPLFFWEREVISYIEGGPFVWMVGVRKWSTFSGLSAHEERMGQSDFLFAMKCVRPEDLAVSDKSVRAFLFWSRVPVLEKSETGTILLRDARYYDPRARNSFTVALPDVKCEPL